MRLQKALTESASLKTLDDITEFIVKYCKPYLKEMGFRKGRPPEWMYSGRNNREVAFIKKVRSDRRPLDTPFLVHDTFDSLFQKKFGWKARSNSIFCTGREVSAASYGKPFIIIPIGDFRFIYSMVARDLYDYIRTSPLIYATGVHIERGANPTKEELEKIIDFFKDTVDSYTNKNLAKGIKDGVEIMVHCNEYLAVSSQLENMLNRYFMDNDIK